MIHKAWLLRYHIAHDGGGHQVRQFNDHLIQWLLMGGQFLQEIPRDCPFGWYWIGFHGRDDGAGIDGRLLYDGTRFTRGT